MGTLTEKLKAQKGLLLIVIPALLGAILLVLSQNKAETIPETESTVSMGETAETVCAQLEARVASLIGRMDGVSEVSVLLTLDCGSETVYARNGSESTGSQYVVIDGKNGDYCVPVKTVEPRLRGAAVICSGGNDAAVQMRITALLSALFGMPSNRIYVSG